MRNREIERDRERETQIETEKYKTSRILADKQVETQRDRENDRTERQAKVKRQKDGKRGECWDRASACARNMRVWACAPDCVHFDVFLTWRRASICTMSLNIEPGFRKLFFWLQIAPRAFNEGYSSAGFDTHSASVISLCCSESR